MMKLEYKEGKAYVLRTCNADMVSHGGFKWPESGYVECPDWSPRPILGHGLHGLLNGIGEFCKITKAHDAKWLIVEVDEATVVNLYGIVKFPAGNVVYCGCMAEALAMMYEYLTRHPYYEDRVLGDFTSKAATGQDIPLLSDGDYSHLATCSTEATAWSSGTDSKLTACGDGSRLVSTGPCSHLATVGHGSCLVATDSFSHLAATGKGSQIDALAERTHAHVSGDHSRAYAHGDRSVAVGTGVYNRLKTGNDSISAALEEGGIVSSGESGCIILSWYDTKNKRIRVKVGYVGEDGIKPNTFYGLNDDNEFQEWS